MVTLVMRFLFIFFFAKLVAPETLAQYGIFTVSIGYMLYLVGLDFHTFATREILQSDFDHRGKMIKGQLALAIAMFLLICPLALAFFKNQDWAGYMIIWFYPLLVLELLNQEISRLLVVLSEQLAASALTFIRQGSWPILAVLVMQYEEGARNLNTVMALWTATGIVAALLGLLKLGSLNISGWHLPIDWKWIKKGVSVSLAFLLATMALRGLQTFDRYAIESWGEVNSLAAYVLLIGVASTLSLFLDAGLFSFSYPQLITLNNNNERRTARKAVEILLLQTVALCTSFFAVSMLALPYLLDWIDNPVYKSEAHIYPWLLAAIALNGISMVPHYALYAMRKDKPIIYSQVMGFLVFLCYTFFSSGSFSVYTVIYGLIFGYSVIGVWKSVIYLVVIRRDIHAEFLHPID